MFRMELSMPTPMMIRAGAVAADGIIRAKGVSSRVKAKQTLVEIGVSPVFSCLHAGGGFQIGGHTRHAEQAAQSGCHGIHLEHLVYRAGCRPHPEIRPFAPTPRAVPKVEKKSGTNMAIRKGR